jgi:hypothetical protein
VARRVFGQIGRELDRVQNPVSWEFSFAATGVPLAIKPSDQAVQAPIVTYVKPTPGNHGDFTVGRLTGTGDRAWQTLFKVVDSALQQLPIGLFQNILAFKYSTRYLRP